MKNLVSAFLKLSLICFFALNAFQSFSQQDPTPSGFSSYEATYDRFANDFARFVDSKSLSHRLTEKDIKGSPYLNKDFIPATVYTNKNIHYTSIPLRYNIFNDVMEFRLPNDSVLAISNPNIIRKIEIGGQTFIYLYTDMKNGGYYSLKVEGKAQLLSKYNVKFNDEVPAGAFQQEKPPSFQLRANSYFIKMKDNFPARISKKKDLKRIFGDRSAEMLSYFKYEKLNLHEEADLIQLVEYFNQSK